MVNKFIHLEPSARLVDIDILKTLVLENIEKDRFNDQKLVENKKANIKEKEKEQEFNALVFDIQLNSFIKYLILEDFFAKEKESKLMATEVETREKIEKEKDEQFYNQPVSYDKQVLIEQLKQLETDIAQMKTEVQKIYEERKESLMNDLSVHNTNWKSGMLQELKNTLEEIKPLDHVMNALKENGVDVSEQVLTKIEKAADEKWNEVKANIEKAHNDRGSPNDVLRYVADVEKSFKVL